MIDYKNVDIQALMDIVKCAENRHGVFFRMSSWCNTVYITSSDRLPGHRCGTSGCLIGTWAMDNPSYARTGEWWDEIRGSPYWDKLIKRLGLSSNIASFVFTQHSGNASMADRLTREEAIARLRKMIYYILHKREILGGDEETDKESRAVYDLARRTGDIGVAKMVRQDVAELSV